MAEQDKNKLQVLQNSCIRTCLKCDKLTPRATLYSASGIVPLEVQHLQNTAGLAYLGVNQESTPFVNKLFSKVQYDTGRVLRSEINEDLVVPKTRLKVCRNNVRYRGPVIYNQIDRGIRNAKTLKNFKKRLKQNNVFNP